MEGIITKGTTLRGRTLNAGDHVDISPEDYNLFKLSGDIEPVPATPDEGKAADKPSKKK